MAFIKRGEGSIISIIEPNKVDDKKIKSALKKIEEEIDSNKKVSLDDSKKLES